MLSKYPIHPDYFDVEDTNAEAERAGWSYESLKAETEALAPMNQELIDQADDLQIDIYKVRCDEDTTVNMYVFCPKDIAGQKTPLLFNIHGGGFAGAIFPHQLSYAMQYARELSCRVAMPDYRTALDHPFPVPFTDSYSCYLWAADHAEELNIYRDQIMVYGDSAGGSIAAAICQKAKDDGDVMPCHLMLLYPVTDCNPDRASVKKYWLTPGFCGFSYTIMYDYYLKNGDCGMLQYAMPCRSDDVSGFPPVYIEVMECDPLHDEGCAYAKKLENAGVPVDFHEIAQGFHGFDMWADKPFAIVGVSRRINVWKNVIAKCRANAAK